MRHDDVLAMTVSSTKLLLDPSLPPTTPLAELPVFWPPLARGFHRIAYTEWGPRDSRRVVVCAHGFARNGRDFDYLAAELGARRRVVCIDFAGRGRSAWLGAAIGDTSADAGYNLWQNVLDATTLLAGLDVDRVDWIGTSMGGLVGMIIAAMPDNPIRRLVLNDVGCEVPGDFLRVISGYVRADPDFADLDEVEAYLRRIYAGFGALTDEQWRHLALHSHRHKADGVLGLAFDPLIGKSLVEPFADVSMRPFWLQVKCPVLLLRGALSPALPTAVAQETASTGPGAQLVEIADVGHAPALMSASQIALVETWLETGQVH